jgi:hypothetical protein
LLGPGQAAAAVAGVREGEAAREPASLGEGEAARKPAGGGEGGRRGGPSGGGEDGVARGDLPAVLDQIVMVCIGKMLFGFSLYFAQPLPIYIKNAQNIILSTGFGIV